MEIGEPKRMFEFEPVEFPADVPVEPAPTVEPAEPVRVPIPEPVPA